MSPSCRLARHSPSGTGIPFPSPPWPRCQSEAEHPPAHPHGGPQPRVPGDTSGRGTGAKLPGRCRAHRAPASPATLPSLLAARAGSVWHPPCLAPGAWQQDPVLTAPSGCCPWGPGTRRGQPGHSGARSAAEAAGRGQRSPDLLLLPHHLLSFSLATARSPRPPTAPPSHATGARGTGCPRPTAPTAPARRGTGHPSPDTEYGWAPGALKVTGRGTGHGRLPRCLRGHPSVTSLARSEFDGSQPSPSPGPPAAPGLAGVWTRSSRGMSGTPALLRGAGRAPTPQTGRPPLPAPRRLPRWGYHGKAAVAAQGERGLPGAPASSPRAARRDFSVVSSSAARPEGEVPAPRAGQRPPLEGQGTGAALAPHPPLHPLPAPAVLRPVALVPRVHRGCTAPAGRAALPRPRAQHRGAASKGGLASLCPGRWPQRVPRTHHGRPPPTR